MMTTSARSGFRLTSRDVGIVHSVYAHRALTSLQIARLHFPAASRTDPIGPQCRHRLKLLTRHGYLTRQEQPVALAEGRKPLVYFLDRGGAELLEHDLGDEGAKLSWKPSHNAVKWLFLAHLLRTNDVRIAIELAAPKVGLELEEWVDDFSLASPTMRHKVTVTSPKGRTRRMAIIPDGYFSVRSERRRFRAFVEADRATVTLASKAPDHRSWQRKVTAYLAYIRSSQFRARYLATRPFRILVVTTSETRVANMKAVTEQVGGAQLFWFTTYDELTPENVFFQPLWQVAGSSSPASFPYNPGSPEG